MRSIFARRSRRLGVLAAVLLVVAGTLVATSAGAGLVNKGFETGDLTGWTANGNVAVVSGGAAEGSFYGQLQSGNDPPGVESTLSQTFTLALGDSIHGSANYIVADECDYDDAWIEVNGTTIWSADCHTPSGWTGWSFVAPAGGAYTITAHIENTGDNVFSSVMGIDAAPPSTPGACRNAMGDNGCLQLARAAVCGPDGSFQDILETQLTDPMSPYHSWARAAYVDGFGLVCSLTDIVNYGGDPSAYHDAGYKVNEIGLATPEGYTDDGFDAWYEFFTKS
jgi:hypothetical protein